MIVINKLAVGLNTKTYMPKRMLETLYGRSLSDSELDNLIMEGKFEKRFSYYLPTEALLRELGLIPNKVTLEEDMFSVLAKSQSFVLKDIQEIVDASFKGIEANVDKKFVAQLEDAKTAIVTLIEAKGYQTPEQVETLIKSKMADIEAAVVDLKKAGFKEVKNKETKSLKEYFADGFADIKDQMKGMVGKTGTKFNVMLTKAAEDLDDSNFTGNGLEIATTDRSRGLYQQPFMPQWFRNLLPAGSTSKGIIQYLKENGSDGAAAVWDGTGEIAALTAKPGVSPLFEGVTEEVIWIAGIIRIKREMLDDIEWLQGYLARF